MGSLGGGFETGGLVFGVVESLLGSAGFESGWGRFSGSLVSSGCSQFVWYWDSIWLYSCWADLAIFAQKSSTQPEMREAGLSRSA